MISEVYDALREAGAGEEKARRAVEVLVNYDNRFNHFEAELVALKADIQGLRVEMQAGFTRLDARIDSVEGDIRNLGSSLQGSIGNLGSSLRGSIGNLRAIVGITLTIALANLALTGALFIKLFH